MRMGLTDLRRCVATLEQFDSARIDRCRADPTTTSARRPWGRYDWSLSRYAWWVQHRPSLAFPFVLRPRARRTKDWDGDGRGHAVEVDLVIWSGLWYSGSARSIWADLLLWSGRGTVLVWWITPALC